MREDAGAGRPRRLLTRDELAEHLVSTETIARLIEQGLPCLRIGTAAPFAVEAVELARRARRPAVSRWWLFADASIALLVREYAPARRSG